MNRRRFLTASAATAAVLSQRTIFASAQDTVAAGEPTPYKLFFNQPAATWADSLPVGNGRLGACVFGNPSKERIQLNEESIWDGEVRDRNNPNAGTAVQKMRQMLFAGDVAGAEALALTDFLAVPRRLPCYQTLGDLHLDFGSLGDITDYRHELNLNTAVVSTSFTAQGVQYRREVFSSAADQVIVMRFTANQPGKISFTATLDRPANYQTAATAQNRITLFGEALPVNDNPGQAVKERQVGIKYYAELLASVTDGTVFTRDNALSVANATAVTMLLDCTTSYRYPAGEAAMRAAVAAGLLAAASRPYIDLRNRHVADHRSYFRRADISLGGAQDPNAAIPTDQ